MGAYLQVKAAGYTLLVHSEEIRDVMTNQREDSVAGCPGHRLWRGQTLPTIDLPEALGGGVGSRPMALVLDAADHGTFILDVDDAGPMLRLEDTAFRPLPPLPSALARAFDGLLVTDDRRAGLLRVRRGAVSALVSAVPTE